MTQNGRRIRQRSALLLGLASLALVNACTPSGLPAEAEPADADRLQTSQKSDVDRKVDQMERKNGAVRSAAGVDSSRSEAPETELQTEPPCWGEPLRDTMCTMQYSPVCGCDRKTYSNACVAKVAGVLRWTEGACDGGDSLQ